VTENAEELSVASSTLLIDDKTNTNDFSGLRTFYMEDDLATFARVWSGHSAEVTSSRDTYRAGSVARVQEIALTDWNAVANRRVFTQANANRPAETDVQRIQWLLSDDPVFWIIIDDTTWVSTANPVNMDAADYRGQYVYDLISDCMQQSGKNAYILQVSDGHGGYESAIWYGAATLATYDATTKISNVLADVDNSTVFAASLDTRMVSDPSRVYSGVYLPYSGGFAYQQSTATAHAYAQRDTVTQAPNVKTATVASARVARMLTTINTPEDTITTSIVVPSAHVNDIRPGMRVQAKFSHFPAYTSYAYMRVLNRTVTLLAPPDATGSSIYQVTLTLSPQNPAVATGDVMIAIVNGASGSGTTVPEPNDLSTHTWTKLFWSDNFTLPAVSCGAGPPTNQAVGVWVRDVVPGESATVLHFEPTGPSPNIGVWVYELAGIVGGAAAIALSLSDAYDQIANGASKTLTVNAMGVDSVLIGSVAFSKVGYDGGWCVGGVGGASQVLTTTAGTELVNKSLDNDCRSNSQPWSWQSYKTGSGSMSLTVQTLAGSYGSGAYTCGWNTGNFALLIPIDLGSFSFTQNGFDSSDFPGADATVTLPFAP
jgi:hypothetical protein